MHTDREDACHTHRDPSSHPSSVIQSRRGRPVKEQVQMPTLKVVSFRGIFHGDHTKTWPVSHHRWHWERKQGWDNLASV